MRQTRVSWRGSKCPMPRRLGEVGREKTLNNERELLPMTTHFAVAQRSDCAEQWKTVVEPKNTLWHCAHRFHTSVTIDLDIGRVK